MNLDYLNLNSIRNYPIKDGLGRVSNDKLFTIPNSLIVDMMLCSSTALSLGLYISRIVLNSASLLIEISSTGSVFGTFQTALPNTNENFDLIMTPNSTNFPNASGVLTIGTIADTSELPFGEFLFDVASTELLMRVYNPVNVGVSWISFSDAKGNKSVLTGDVQIVGNSNIQFRLDSGTVYIDAGENLGLNKSCVNQPTPIKSINGVGPDSTGNFTLIPEQCVSIDPAQYGLLISDNCGSPCLGCPEINTLTNQVNGLEASIVDIRNFTHNLQIAITQASTLINSPCACN